MLGTICGEFVLQEDPKIKVEYEYDTIHNELYFWHPITWQKCDVEEFFAGLKKKSQKWNVLKSRIEWFLSLDNAMDWVSPNLSTITLGHNEVGWDFSKI